MDTSTKTRGAFMEALTKVDAALRTQRRPIDAKALNLTVEKGRANWAKWSPARRPHALADLAIILRAEIQHGREDFLRIVNAHKAGHLFDLEARIDPAEYYRLPREAAAASAVNAISHAEVQSRRVREEIRVLRKQVRAAGDSSQTNAYRGDWSTRAATTRADLALLIPRRRRDWQRALQLIAAYQKETA